MALILSIETSAKYCSACLSEGEILIASKKELEENKQGVRLTLMLQELLAENNYSFQQLQAIAISEGPGSYTGLRIGFSVAKGLAYGLEIPLITIPTLQAIAFAAAQQINEDALYISMIDARHENAYCGFYNSQNEVVEPVAFLSLDEIVSLDFVKNDRIILCGNTAFTDEFLSKLKNPINIKIVPEAYSMHQLAANKYSKQEFAELPYCEPYYFKEFEVKRKIK